MLRTRHIIVLFVLSLLSSTAHAKVSDFPNLEALGPWMDSGEASESKSISNYPAVKVKCGDYLYPTHPQQHLKEYHLSKVAQYDKDKIFGGKPGTGKGTQKSDVCLISGNGINAKGEHSCERADQAWDYILSDVYMDACGELYRGFTEITFLKHNETMGTLFSPGRATYHDPHSEFAGVMVSDSTHAVLKKDFLKISPLFPGDKEKIAVLQQESAATHVYNPLTHLFINKLDSVSLTESPKVVVGHAPMKRIHNGSKGTSSSSSAQDNSSAR